jgi:hypothetical protein
MNKLFNSHHIESHAMGVAIKYNTLAIMPTISPFGLDGKAYL